jgi:hypothetical protein
MRLDVSLLFANAGTRDVPAGTPRRQDDAANGVAGKLDLERSLRRAG